MTLPPGEYAVSPHITQNSLMRRQISQYSGKVLGLNIRDAQGAADPESISVVVYLNTTIDNSEGQTIIEGSYEDGTVNKEDVGTYTVTLSPEYTTVPARIDAHWSYLFGGATYSYTDYYEVLEPMPFYETLNADQKFVIEQVCWTMGDLFDSTTGGPHLMEEFQTHYNYERLAQLLTVAVAKINVMGVITTDYIVGSGDGRQFPVDFNNVLFIALYVEVIRHFCRTYVEQPEIKGNPDVTYTDRRDYLQRWQSVLKDEKDALDNAVRLMKRKEIGLGRTSMIVAGGIFANNRQFVSGSWAAGVHGSRFFATSFVYPVGWGSGA
jgi:hypothetical protein